MAFETTDDIRVIVQTLRAGGFAWIADELEETIGVGKEEEIEYKEQGAKRVRTGTTSVPYTEEEQEVILARTLRSYFVHTYEVWQAARTQLMKSLKLTDIKIVLGPPEETMSAERFSQQFLAIRASLADLLDKIDPVTKIH